MKKISNIITALIIFLMSLPLSVFADSGLDSNYDAKSPADLISSFLSVLSTLIKLLFVMPNDEDYSTCHIIMVVICIIVFIIVTNVYLFKLNDKKKKAILVLLISLIPTLIFTLICFLIKTMPIVYIIILTIYILIFRKYTNKKFKEMIEEKISIVKKIDKKFDLDELNKNTFDIYKKVQLAWMDFDLDELKKYISEEMFEQYIKQLEELQKDKRKNIMSNIDFVSNEITNIKIENKIEVIECLMKVTCNDYIIDENEKVVKGKKEKLHTYKYKLVFNKDLKTNKYTLVKKKMNSQK